MLRQRKQKLFEKKWGHINDLSYEGNKNQSHDGNNNNSELSNTGNTSPDINNIVRQHASTYDYSEAYCDIDDEEDEFQINATAVLQHYVIVWASILTSPKG